MLDKFEEKFLGFCNYNPDAKDISLTDEIISPTYNQTGGIHNLEEKSLVSQINALFVVSKTGIDFVNQILTHFLNLFHNFLTEHFSTYKF